REKPDHDADVFTHHVSRITFHASRFTHHVSHFTFHISRFSTMDRRVEPEFLDELPATDPRAIRSRRDLQSLNAWMGNTQIMARELRSAFPHEPPQRLVELGAGDATFHLQVAQRLAPHWQGTTALLVDRKQIVTPE